MKTVSTSDWKNSVRLATTGPFSKVAHPASVDGQTLKFGNRVLLWQQTNGAENGIYVVGNGGRWDRAEDMNEGAEVEPGLTVYVEEGSLHQRKNFVLTNTGKIVLGTTVLTFSGSPFVETDPVYAASQAAKIIGWGTTTLVGGTKDVADARVTATTHVFLDAQNTGSAQGNIWVASKTAGVGFTINSESGSDDRDIAYLLVAIA